MGFAQQQRVPVQSLSMDTADIIKWLRSTYAFDGPITCKLLRSYTNDVYSIRHIEHQYVLKIYGIHWRTGFEIEYEVELLDFLIRKGLRIAEAVTGVNRQKVYTIPTTAGSQCAVLFEFAEGEKPQPPFSNALYYAFGQSIARLHKLSNDFKTQHARRPLDLACTVDAPLELALPCIAKDEDRTVLKVIANTVKTKLTELSLTGLDWGPIHGDATLDNLHVTEEGAIVLYDFDSCGFGWRAADLQGWAKSSSDYTSRWLAFQKGYRSVREINAPDLEAAPYLAIAWQIWGLQIDMEQRIMKQGTDKVTCYLARQIAAIKKDAESLFQ